MSNYSLSYPFNGRGGILLMGRMTYWDTLIWLLKGLSRVIDNENLDKINAIKTAPYIRSFAVSANYRFTPDLELRLNFFFGSDGVAADYKTDYKDEGIIGRMRMTADYDNYQGFLIAGLTASPMPKMALRFSGGIGFMETKTDDMIDNNVTVKYKKDFLDAFDLIRSTFDLHLGDTYTAPNMNASAKGESTVFTVQQRADADIDLGKGFITGFGVQELYSLWRQRGDISLDFLEISLKDYYRYGGYLPPEIIPIKDSIPNAAIIVPRGYRLNVLNQGFTTSVYGLVEYKSPNQRIGAELGLRLDHLYFLGKNFNIQTKPALNPRLNIDINIFKNKSVFDSLDITLGTGLFSSMDKLLSFISPDFGDGRLKIKFNRAWTSLVGFKTDIAQGYSFNIETYYKRVFNRAYITADAVSSSNIKPEFSFDGVGNIWGFDLQLQKLESRYLDGWISYTFTWAKYHDPSGGSDGISMLRPGTNEGWYYPSFHRFHYCNIVLNIKPLQWFHIGLRFGFASGQPRNKVGDEIYSYPVLLNRGNGLSVGDYTVIQKYGRDSWYDDNERGAWSLPLDIKFSFFLANRKGGRENKEIYIAAENLSTLFYHPPGNTTFNEYTGKEDKGSSGASGFDLPFPMISFGIKWRY